jgi:protein-S-isoprenylcysteine O-methyltransferase Ste14
MDAGTDIATVGGGIGAPLRGRDGPVTGDTGGMASSASSDGTAQLLLNLSAVGFALSEISIRVRSARSRRGRSVDHGSLIAVVVTLAVGALIAIWSAVRVPTALLPFPRTSYVVGLMIIWLGIALRQWAVWTLGPFFTVVVRVAARQTVVESGPYRWVRHPSYTGLLVTLLGLGVALGNWLSMLALVTVPVLGLVIRIRVEERELLSGLGEPYRRYCEQRKRLVPGIW